MPMKKITILILILSTSFLNAQTNPATPNAGFESWTHHSTYDDPNGWNDLNSSTSVFGIYTCIKDSTPADVHSGKNAVRLITMTYFGQLIPGTITTGTINTTSQTISGGLPYTLRPDSIIGWFKYTPASGDNGDIEFYLFDASSDTVGEAFFKTPTTTVSTYKRFSLPVTYRSSNAVTMALWILTSSINQTSGKSGSELYADDLGLVFDSATGINNIVDENRITISPNLATDYVTINNISDSPSVLFSLYDITGRKVSEEKTTQGKTNIALNGLSEGLYFYSITDEQNSVIKSGKIVVQK